MATRITEMMLISTRKFVLDNYGPSAWQRALEAMGTDARRRFERELTAKRRFDFPVAVDLLESVVQACDSADVSFVLNQLGRHNAEDDLGSTERLLMRVFTVKMVLKIASMLWTSRVKDGGRLIISSKGKKAVEGLIEQPPDASPLWWNYLAGWFQRTIELAGGSEVTARWTEGGRRPGEAAHFDVSWN